MQTSFFYRDPKAPVSNQPIGLGVVLLVHHHNRFLMEKRSDSDRWAFIGGRLEVDESLEDAVRREAFEETGLRISSVHRIGIYDDPSRIISYSSGQVKRIVSVVYFVNVDSLPELKISNESEELAFLSIDQIKCKKIAETHVPIVSDLETGWSVGSGTS